MKAWFVMSYKCTANPPRDTIGVGRNLNDVGISEEEAMFLLDNDIKKSHWRIR